MDLLKNACNKLKAINHWAMNSIQHFVDGKNTANSKRTGKVFNPSTGEQSSKFFATRGC